MAILDNYKVWIESNGEPLKEFGSTTDSITNTITCWIESRAGEVITIHWKDKSKKRQTASEVKVFLDGAEVDRSIYDHEDKTRAQGVVDRVFIEGQRSRKIIFADVASLSGNPDVKPSRRRDEDERTNSLTGTIVVGVDKVVMMESKEWIVPGVPAYLLAGGLPDAMAAISKSDFKHIIQLGEELLEEDDEEEQNIVYYSSVRSDGQPKRKEPDFKFKFYYRPRKALQNIGISVRKKRSAQPINETRRSTRMRYQKSED